MLLVVLLAGIVPKLLYTEHIAVVGHSQTSLTVCNGLIDKPFDACLTIQYRVLAMNVKMDEIVHNVTLVYIATNIQTFSIIRGVEVAIS